ncbi:MAG: ATP-binding cassette domain-containing protein [Rhodospirillales bacterium]|nr:ATP-binding cassette domain-containing protein [Rhodospirillales bacterium]
MVKAVLDIRNVSKIYDGIAVLKDISLRVRTGELVCIVGPSGAGKTTLLRVIAALTPCDSGEVYRFGTRLDYARRWPNDSRIGFVFQESRLFPHLSALDNCLLAPVHVQKKNTDVAKREVMALLDRLMIGDIARQFPHSLSGGQRQRVAIARTLALRPALILLDEITANLDPENIANLLAVLKDIVRDDRLTCLANTHHLGFAETVGDRLLFLEKGNVLADGNPRDVLHKATHRRIQDFVTAIRKVENPDNSALSR